MLYANFSTSNWSTCNYQKQQKLISLFQTHWKISNQNALITD